MKHNCVYYHIFEVNNMLIANEGKEVKGAHICRDGDYCLAKIATKEDIEMSYGKEDE